MISDLTWWMDEKKKKDEGEPLCLSLIYLFTQFNPSVPYALVYQYETLLSGADSDNSEMMLPFGAVGVPAGRHDGRGDPDLRLLSWRKSL